MKSNLLEINQMKLLNGHLGICMCPGANLAWAGVQRDVDQDMGQLLAAGVTDAVVLLPDDEITAISPNLMHSYQTANIEVMHFPIANMSVPHDEKAFRELVADVLGKLQRGRFVVAHCMAGRGRAGTVFACVLRAVGYSPDDALLTVRSVRRGAVQSVSQEMFVEYFQP